MLRSGGPPDHGQSYFRTLAERASIDYHHVKHQSSGPGISDEVSAVMREHDGRPLLLFLDKYDRNSDAVKDAWAQLIEDGELMSLEAAGCKLPLRTCLISFTCPHAGTHEDIDGSRFVIVASTSIGASLCEKRSAQTTKDDELTSASLLAGLWRAASESFAHISATATVADFASGKLRDTLEEALGVGTSGPSPMTLLF